MKSQKWKKLGYLFAATLVLGSASVGTVGVFADTTGDATAAQVASAVVDPDKEQSVTFHKFLLDSASQIGANSDGNELTPDQLEGLKGLDGINFRIREVTLNGSDIKKPIYTTNYNATEEEKNKGDNITGTNYSFVTGGKDTTVTTGADGVVKADLGKSGKVRVFLVQELPDAQKRVGMPAEPFFLYAPMTQRATQGSEDGRTALLYDIHVYPKNIKANKNEPVKWVGQMGDSTHSVKAGEEFKWFGVVNVLSGMVNTNNTGADLTVNYLKEDGSVERSIVVPNGGKYYADYFEIAEDGFDSAHLEMLTDKITVEYLLSDASDENDEKAWKTDLVLQKTGSFDLTSTTYDAFYDTTTNTVKFTQRGMEKLNTLNATKVRVVYHTKATDENFNGIIQNKITSRFRVPNIPPLPPENIPKIPENPYGGFDFKKTDEKDDALKDAVFKVAETEADAKAGKFVKNAAGDADLSATSNAQGIVAFDGLSFDIAKEHFTETGKLEEGTLKRVYTKDYWVVETKSPSGYELYTVPTKVTMKATVTYDKDGKATVVAAESTWSDNKQDVTIKNVPTSNLPFTGGNGLIKLVLTASALGAIGIAGIYLTRKKENKA